MSNNSLTAIDEKIDALVNDKTAYSFIELKQRVEKILKSEDIFLSNNKLDTKAFDLYFNIVITKRNKTKEKSEQSTAKTDPKVAKYSLIEQICKKLSFESNEEVIKKVEELEAKSLMELSVINTNL